MDMGRMTILSLLQQENSAIIKQCHQPQPQPAFCTLEEKDIMVKIAADRVLAAQRTIANAVKKWLLKTQAKSGVYLADIYFEADYDIAQTIQIVGEFTQPAWSLKLTMKYSFFHRAFHAQVKIYEGCQFKFIVDGTFICCPRYPLVYTKDKFSNNIFRTKN